MTQGNIFSFLNGIYRADLQAETLSANRAIKMPNASGTLVVYSEADGISSSLVKRLDLATVSSDYPLILPGGRMTTASLASSLTIVDAVDATTLNYKPHIHNSIPLWDSSISRWRYWTLPDAGIALPNLTALAPGNYEIFARINNGTMQMHYLLGNATTVRAVDLVRKHGILVTSSSPTDMTYLGCVRTTGTSGTTKYQDHDSQRFIFNAYNREPRRIYKTDNAASWTYNSATVRAMNASSANRIELIHGLDDGSSLLKLERFSRAIPGSGNGVVSGIGLNSTTSITDAVTSGVADTTLVRTMTRLINVGYHSVYALEGCFNASAIVTFYGNGLSGMEGVWQC